VHGFKQTFETAALDAVHLSDGIKFRGQTMVFSWPSKAGLFDYAYDRESAMWSRDDFERVLHSIVATSSAGRVHIVAHSMGTMLTLEGLRCGDSIADRIGAVVFAAPDIDMSTVGQHQLSTWPPFSQRTFSGTFTGFLGAGSFGAGSCFGTTAGFGITSGMSIGCDPG
jgi:esterase/lipase superfamily enzyme